MDDGSSIYTQFFREEKKKREKKEIQTKNESINIQDKVLLKQVVTPTNNRTEEMLK